MRTPKKKKKAEYQSHIEDLDVLKIPVNGCTTDSTGKITRVHMVGHFYLDVANQTLTNLYSSGERKISAEAVRDAVERAELWRKCWDACSSE